jgi:hypothetical protein
MNLLLLMTATIDPGRPHFVVVDDPWTRLRQYVTSLILWARLRLFSWIVFCENSHHPIRLDPLVQIAEAYGSSDLEILRIHDNSGSWIHGKSWGEARLIEAALTRSRLLQKTERFWKVTGRLFVTNARRLVELHLSDPNVLDGGETRFFKADKGFFSRNILPMYARIHEPEGRTIEWVHSHALQAPGVRDSVVGFREPPIFVGQCGGTGQIYGPVPEDASREAERWIAAFEHN